jgi:orotate phosphoribosyltransferase-like protein
MLLKVAKVLGKGQNWFSESDEHKTQNQCITSAFMLVPPKKVCTKTVAVIDDVDSTCSGIWEQVSSILTLLWGE